MFYHEQYLKSITNSLRILADQINKPYLFSQEFWTVAATIVAFVAVIVALFTPFLMSWLSNRPKKSKLVVKDTRVINQEASEEYQEASEEYQKHTHPLLNVGIVIIKNTGQYKASSVEAYVEEIFDEGKKRSDFIPMPLVWTHGQLNKNGPTIRDIYPNQEVSLDFFNHKYDDGYVGDNIVSFAVATGHFVDNLSRMALGESKISIVLYQESGQVDTIRLKVIWDGVKVPKLSVL